MHILMHIRIYMYFSVQCLKQIILYKYSKVVSSVFLLLYIQVKSTLIFSILYSFKILCCKYLIPYFGLFCLIFLVLIFPKTNTERGTSFGRLDFQQSGPGPEMAQKNDDDKYL